MSYPVYFLGPLPPNTIVPTNQDLFIPYLNRLYEDIAYAVNNRDYTYFPIPITSSAANIPNVPTFGSFVLCISGVDTTLPTLVVALCKSDSTASGTVAVLTSQVGTGAWAGFSLTVTSTATNYQVAHNNTGISGNFNIRILGTQG